MKLLSYGLDIRMEPRLAFSLGGYVVDVMRASLWMKEKHKAQDYLSLASNMALTLEDWGRSASLLKNLEHAFKGLELSGLSIYDRAIALPESEVIFFSPIPEPPGLRYFSAFQSTHEFSFGNTQTLMGHHQTIGMAGLSPQGELAGIIGGKGSSLEIAGYSIINNWVDTSQDSNDGLAMGKATSMGPYLVTSDELEGHKLGNSFKLDMQVRHNGKIASEARFKEMNLSFENMIQSAQATNVRAGDIFCSGSPIKLNTMPTAQAGDQVEVEIQVLGTLSNQIETQTEAPFS